MRASRAAWVAVALLGIAALRPALPLSAQSKPKPASNERVTAAAPKPAADPLHALSDALQRLTAKVSPAVVQIQVTGYGPVGSDRASASVIGRQSAIGSGVIVDPDGYVITNYHVVRGAQRVRVLLTRSLVEESPARVIPTGSEPTYEAQLVGADEATDLALLKINVTGLPTLPLAERPVRQGQLVMAIGSPEGLENSVSMGVVSSVARQPDPDHPMIFIQTDAPINPGNSGGALVDVDGNIVGINTFILTESGGSEGLGFAIPIPIANFVYNSLRKKGHVDRPSIGVGVQTITPEMARGLSLGRSFGVIVADVQPGGPAQASKVNPGDIILAVDDKAVDTLPEFSASFYTHPPDAPMKLELLRGTTRLKIFVPVVQEERQADKLAGLADAQTSFVPRLGILGVDVTEQLAQMMTGLRIASGVAVAAKTAEGANVDPDLHAGDVIHALNGAQIRSLAELRGALESIRPGDAVVLQLERQGGLQYSTFEMP